MSMLLFVDVVTFGRVKGNTRAQLLNFVFQLVTVSACCNRCNAMSRYPSSLVEFSSVYGTYLFSCFSFCPRDAVHDRSICCLSVRLSVTIRIKTP